MSFSLCPDHQNSGSLEEREEEEGVTGSGSSDEESQDPVTHRHLPSDITKPAGAREDKDTYGEDDDGDLFARRLEDLSEEDFDSDDDDDMERLQQLTLQLK